MAGTGATYIHIEDPDRRGPDKRRIYQKKGPYWDGLRPQSFKAGELNPKWKGGLARPKGDGSGYLVEWHPTLGKILQHRRVMEEKLGRSLLPNENVHHINGIRSDNRPENLELWTIKQPLGQRVGDVKHCPTCTCEE